MRRNRHLQSCRQSPYGTDEKSPPGPGALHCVLLFDVATARRKRLVTSFGLTCLRGRPSHLDGLQPPPQIPVRRGEGDYLVPLGVQFSSKTFLSLNCAYSG